MKFEKTCVWGFDHAIRGMRNPKESWDRSDSYRRVVDLTTCMLYEDEEVCEKIDKYAVIQRIGPNDMQLIHSLIEGGPEHRKFMRQIMVSVDITAPLYWWKEFDTYKVGTTANSTSTMHKLASKPITIDCFEVDDYNEDLNVVDWSENSLFNPYDPPYKMSDISGDMIAHCEKLRQLYIQTKDKRYWKELVRWLPEGWLQTRTVTMSYENLYNMGNQREFHKQNEWSGKDDPALPNFIAWEHSLPFADQIIFWREERKWH